VKTRRSTCSMKSGSSEVARAAACPVSPKKPDSRVTVAIEQPVAELAVDATLNDIVRKAQSIKTAIIQSRSRRNSEHLC